MTRSGNIGFIVEGRDVTNGLVHLSVRMLHSSLPQKTTNELPIILNALKAHGLMDVDANICFTYTFPFPLAQGFGFPYLLDMQFEDDDLLTLM